MSSSLGLLQWIATIHWEHGRDVVLIHNHLVRPPHDTVLPGVVEPEFVLIGFLYFCDNSSGGEINSAPETRLTRVTRRTVD